MNLRLCFIAFLGLTFAVFGGVDAPRLKIVGAAHAQMTGPDCSPLLGVMSCPIRFAGGGVAKVDTGTFGVSGATGSYTYTGMTVSAGANALIAIIMANDSGPSDVLSSVTWNGTNMTALVHQTDLGSGGSVWIYGLRSPASGNQNLVVNLTTGTDRFYVSAISFSGVNVTSDATAFPTAGRVTGAGSSGNSPANLSIPSNTGHQVVAGFFNDNTGAGSALNLTAIDSNNAFNIAVLASYGAGANPSTTATATWTGTNGNGIAGVDVSN